MTTKFDYVIEVTDKIGRIAILTTVAKSLFSKIKIKMTTIRVSRNM
jgi:hypothetical protein